MSTANETEHLPTTHEQIAERQSLRLDYSVECEHCGYLQDLPRSLSEPQAQKHLAEKGWRLVDDENRCPTCAKGDFDSPIVPIGATDLGSMFEHTPDEGEPHLMTECESRGCVKLQ